MVPSQIPMGPDPGGQSLAAQFRACPAARSFGLGVKRKVCNPENLHGRPHVSGLIPAVRGGAS